MSANADLIEAVAGGQFVTLTGLEVVWNDTDDEPWYSTGRQGLVFRLREPATGREFALKVFKQRAADRDNRLRRIAEQLAAYPSPYWVSYRCLAGELRVEPAFGPTETADVLLMDWVEGSTLGQYVADCCRHTNQIALYKLAYAFDQMALWLLANPFAHGDLKHDNILIRPDGLPVLVDYDGLYFPVFAGLEALELGTPDYQHPQRSPQHFGPYLDDFSVLVISLSLYALAHQPALYTQYNTGENLILTQTDFEQPRRGQLLNMRTLRQPLMRHHDQPRRSQLLSTLQKLVAPEVRQRLALLNDALTLDIQKLPSLEVLLKVKVASLATVAKNHDLILPELIPYRRGKLWGYCDRNKNIVIDCQYEDAQRFVNGLAVVKKDWTQGMIDKTGKFVIPNIYPRLDRFEDGYALMGQAYKFGLMNQKGQIVILPTYNNLLYRAEGLIAAWKWVDISLLQPYTKIKGSSGLNKAYGFIDVTGRVVIPFQFREALSFHEGLAAVSHHYPPCKWGFIDKTGRQVIPFSFDEVWSFSEGLARVERRDNLGGYGYIDKRGQLVIPFQ